MTRRRALLLTVVIVLLGLVLSIIFGPGSPKPAKKVVPAACSQTADPCIALVNNTGMVVAKFNDFRFCGQGCILYKVNGQWKQYSGGYTLNWIGPQPAPGVVSKV